MSKTIPPFGRLAAETTDHAWRSYGTTRRSGGSRDHYYPYQCALRLAGQLGPSRTIEDHEGVTK